jgi:imidazolonepropionase
MAKTLITHIHQIMTMTGVLQKKSRGPIFESDLGLLKKQALVFENGKILWIGSQNKIPREHRGIKKQIRADMNLYPGWVDCHTHSLFAGNRTHEFEMRVRGVSYQEIASQGGGILHTVQETRKASDKNLKDLLQARMQNFLAQGVTTVEVKSGYGLSIEAELRLLKIIKSTKTNVKMTATFLGAHALPPEEKTTSVYLQKLKGVLQQIAQKKLASRVDIFIEKNYFSVEESKAFLNEAKNLGLELTIHADQMTRTGATALAVDLEAKSADHVICLNDQDIQKVAASEVTCVLLPTADFYLRCPYPPARKLIDQGARCALATDFNPGTSPTQNIQWVGLLARQEMKMTLPEVFAALTTGGAYALGLQNKCGVMAPGFDADFYLTPKNWDEFFYDMSPIPIDSVWVNGQQYIV